MLSLHCFFFLLCFDLNPNLLFTHFFHNGSTNQTTSQRLCAVCSQGLQSHRILQRLQLPSLYAPALLSLFSNRDLHFTVVIFGGALIGFVLSRFYYLDFDGVFCSGKNTGASPGECYWWVQRFYKIGIILHLATILRELKPSISPKAKHH